MKIFYSWLGNSDLRAVDGGQKRGAVADFLLHNYHQIDLAILLFDCNEQNMEKGNSYLSWLTQELASVQSQAEVILKPVPRNDPTSFSWVFDTMRQVITETEQKNQLPPDQIKRAYLVGPGTPTMASCTLVIAQMQACRGELWQADERSPLGIRKLELPFGLQLHDAPALGCEQHVSDHHSLICSSANMQRVMRLAHIAAQSDLPVLILGSTGTGKEEIAKRIAKQSCGKESFLALNCGAIPSNLIEAELFGYKKGAFTGATRDQAGAFESAKAGVLFLDEIGDLPLEAQVKLLRVLQEKQVTRLGEYETRPINCRIVAATHRNLWQHVERGLFRADLYYRLANIIIELPDLQDRPDDLKQMLTQFWHDTVTKNPGFPGRELSPAAQQSLLAYPWPGNVRELKATLARLAFLATTPYVELADVEQALPQLTKHLPAPVVPITAKAEAQPLPLTLKEQMKQYQQQLVHSAVLQAQGNRARAANALGISVQHLGRVLKG